MFKIICSLLLMIVCAFSASVEAYQVQVTSGGPSAVGILTGADSIISSHNVTNNYFMGGSNGFVMQPFIQRSLMDEEEGGGLLVEIFINFKKLKH